SSNMRLGAGIAPVRELLDAGVRVGLGVDGSASNERGDLFLEVKQALLVARARGGPTALTARDALRLGTRGGASVLGRDDIVELWQDDLLTSGETDADGRISELAANLDPGTYRLLFRPESPFYKSIGIEVALEDGHYHVPLLISSYSCTTYRGS